MIYLITGGSGSGKSAYAEEVVTSLGECRRIYVATMQPWDEECRQRIQRHQQMRAHKGFETVECYGNPDTLRLGPVSTPTVLLLECMSNLLSNILYAPDSGIVAGQKEETVQCVYRGLQKLAAKVQNLVIVTNEVFSDGMEYDPMTTEYMEILGQLNRQVAAEAGYVAEVTAGIPVVLKDMRAEGRAWTG